MYYVLGGGLVGVAPHVTRQIFFSTDFDIFVSQKNQCFKKDSTDSEPDGEETHTKKNRFKNHQTMMNLMQQ